MPSRKRRCKDLILLTDTDSRDPQSLLTSFVKFGCRDTSSSPSCHRKRRHHTCVLTGGSKDLPATCMRVTQHASQQTLTGDASCEMHLGKISQPKLVWLLVDTKLAGLEELRGHFVSSRKDYVHSHHQLRYTVSNNKNRPAPKDRISTSFS